MVKNLGAPDYASIEDRRKTPSAPPTREQSIRDFISRIPADLLKKKNPSAEDDKPNLSRRIMLEADKSASAALQRMGNQPLPSRRPAQGNNPGSVATMKFPKTSRSK